MKLSQKIKHIKRHRANKRFAKFADNVHFAAAECFLDGNDEVFIVSSRLYNVMNRRKGCVPKNIKQSPLSCDRQIITVPRDITEFCNDNKLDYIKGWVDTTLNCPNGMPYIYTDIKPSVSAPVPSSVAVKEI